MAMNYEQDRDQAIKDLREQIDFLKEGMKAARSANDGKAYAALLRLYLPAQRDLLRLCREQENFEQTDELLDFQQGFSVTGRKVSDR